MTAAELRSEITTGPLAAQLAADWAAGRTGAVANRLNARTLTLDVPAPMYFNDLMGLVTAGTISQASFAKVWQHPRFSEFYADVAGQNHFAVANLYPAAFATDASITSQEAAAIAAYAARTSSVPASRIEVLAGTLGEAVSITQVDAARALP